MMTSITTTMKTMTPQARATAALLALMTVLMLAPDSAHASNAAQGAEFDSIWDTLTDWLEGTLGRIVAGAMILVGVIAGVARQSLMAFAIGIGGGIGLYNTPTIVDNLFSATLDQAPEATLLLMTLSNGLGG